MTYSYKWLQLLRNEEKDTPYQVIRTGNGQGVHIIDTTGNHPDAVLYREWAAAGNTPDAADAGLTDWDLVREKRDCLLKNSDWAMTTGATIDQAQWSAYREKLRDIPQTYKDKETSEIVWPTAPSSKGPNS